MDLRKLSINNYLHVDKKTTGLRLETILKTVALSVKEKEKLID